ncbi:MAG: DUF2625 domain-containing protein [Blastocatellia bacterium]
MRTSTELINHADPAWPLLRSWIHEATNHVEILPARDPDCAEALAATQVSTQSTMGALVYETGGLLIDHGWVRILGSGHPRLPRSLPAWNAGRTVMEPEQPPPFLLVADDAIGGFFAINAGGLGMALRNVCYFPPDRLAWEDLGRGYSAFIHWIFSANLDAFYEGSRWPGWVNDVRALDGDKAYSIYPPLFAQGPPVGERSRKAVPIAELYGLYLGEEA